MAKPRVSLKLEPGECEAVKAFANEHGITISKAGRELVRQGHGMGGHLHLQNMIQRLATRDKRCRRAQICCLPGIGRDRGADPVHAKDDYVAREILEALFAKSDETLRKEEERGDYR